MPDAVSAPRRRVRASTRGSVGVEKALRAFFITRPRLYRLSFAAAARERAPDKSITRSLSLRDGGVLSPGSVVVWRPVPYVTNVTRPRRGRKASSFGSGPPSRPQCHACKARRYSRPQAVMTSHCLPRSPSASHCFPRGPLIAVGTIAARGGFLTIDRRLAPASSASGKKRVSAPGEY